MRYYFDDIESIDGVKMGEESTSTTENDITITKFDLLLGGNCFYRLHNNSLHTITLTSFKLLEGVDAIDNEYTPPNAMVLPPNESRGALYGDPKIEKICNRKGQAYSLDVAITYILENGETKTVRQGIKGICTDWEWMR